MKILFLQKRILFPTDTGGKIRTLNVVRYLAQWHDVTYLCNVQEGDEAHCGQMKALGLRLVTIPWKETSRQSLRFYGELALNLLSPYPYNVAKDFDPALRRRAEELLATEKFDLVICDFVQMARNAIDLDAPAKVLFQHNVEAEIFRRHAQNDKGWLRRCYMGRQWDKMRRFEAEAGKHFDAVVAVSQRDSSIYESEYGWRHARTIDTAVDVDYFKPNGDRETPDCVLFVGSMDWLANQDAVEFFVKSIWPAIREVCPHARFQVVGRNPSRSIKRLADYDGVEVVGYVDDVRPYLQAASVVVVPLRIGGGTRIKIFEAMAMQKAVVSTSLGAEGLAVDAGSHLLLADEPGQFADAVIDLLKDDKRRADLANCARTLVCEKFSAEQVARQFEAILLETVAQSN